MFGIHLHCTTDYTVLITKNKIKFHEPLQFTPKYHTQPLKTVLVEF